MQNVDYLTFEFNTFNVFPDLEIIFFDAELKPKLSKK
jgi:hypothetical protein